MGIPVRIKNDFSPTIQSRGAQYHSEGKIISLHKDGKQVKAVVRGNKLYDVDLLFYQSTLDVECTCPYFDGAGVCKHIWAVLLECYEKDLFDEMTWYRITETEPYLPFDDDDDDFFDEDYTGEEGYYDRSSDRKPSHDSVLPEKTALRTTPPWTDLFKYPSPEKYHTEKPAATERVWYYITAPLYTAAILVSK